MFVSNPFSLLTEFLSPVVMQIYVVLMLLAVALGTLFDLRHKRSAEFFFWRRKQAEAAAQRRLGAAEIASLALRTVAIEVATSGEFCQWPRRLSHLLMSYGFAIYLVTTLAMVFIYPTAVQTPIALTALWNVGALMVLIGGSWFFFRLRVNVVHDGHSIFHLMRADLFIATLLASMACGLLWHFAQALQSGAAASLALFALYIFFSTLLFVSVPWSKFAHMFYKPMAAFQKRLEEANGASDLPRPAGGSNIRN
ncbi:MAG: hypothetical protein PHY45_04435 [Rhodocyclaceae bacterium]|nr:hypothetical protein [Rhodocyclaceae bacterium]